MYSGKTPVAEYYYWVDRETGLEPLIEQLDGPSVTRILNILHLAKSDIGYGFDNFAEDVMEVYTEAKESNKFLSTILRYFKVRARV